MENAVQLEIVDDHIGLLTINEPKKSNAMTIDVVDQFPERLDEISNNSNLRVVVVTGTGDYFCSGADFTTLTELSDRTGVSEDDSGAATRAALQDFYGTFLELLDIPQPTIAAINGAAVGGGLGLALLCDIRIIAHDAKIGGNFPKLGIHPGVGISHFLVRSVGDQMAAKMALTGDLISGKKAVEKGLALKKVPRHDVLESALELAKKIANNAPLSLREITETLRNIRTRELDDTLNQESLAQSLLFQTDDAAEGIAAMLEDREPDFS